jgi:hypothetical protein
MNTLKFNLMICSALLSLGMNMTRAAEQDAAPAPAARAEVLADLEIWRESGLALAQSGDAFDPQTPFYRESLARYQAMRTSPQFAERVDRIARQRGETGQVAQQ